MLLIYLKQSDKDDRQGHNFFCFYLRHKGLKYRQTAYCSIYTAYIHIHCVCRVNLKNLNLFFNCILFLLGLMKLNFKKHKVSESGKSIKPLRKQVVFENTTHCSYSTATCMLNPVTGKRGSPDSLCVTLSQIIGNARALTPTGLRRGIKYVNPQNR